MRTVYLDCDFKCHIANDGTMTAAETGFFDDKCDVFIEGYRLVPFNEVWISEDGIEIHGEMISPWKEYAVLDDVQREYERQLLAEYKMTIAELDAALLDIQYANLVEDL